jgi:hypothetical protein
MWRTALGLLLRPSPLTPSASSARVPRIVVPRSADVSEWTSSGYTSPVTSDLKALIEGFWFQPAPQGVQEREAPSLDELSPAIRTELISLYEECFGPDEPKQDELSRFLKAIAELEFRTDSVLFAGPDERDRQFKRAAKRLGWAPARFSAFSRWWNASPHHRQIHQGSTAT